MLQRYTIFCTFASFKAIIFCPLTLFSIVNTVLFERKHYICTRKPLKSKNYANKRRIERKRAETTGLSRKDGY
jgi:hypothetical protein